MSDEFDDDWDLAALDRIEAEALAQRRAQGCGSGLPAVHQPTTFQPQQLPNDVATPFDTATREGALQQVLFGGQAPAEATRHQVAVHGVPSAQLLQPQPPPPLFNPPNDRLCGKPALQSYESSAEPQQWQSHLQQPGQQQPLRQSFTAAPPARKQANLYSLWNSKTVARVGLQDGGTCVQAPEPQPPGSLATTSWTQGDSRQQSNWGAQQAQQAWQPPQGTAQQGHQAGHSWQQKPQVQQSDCSAKRPSQDRDAAHLGHHNTLFHHPLQHNLQSGTVPSGTHPSNPGLSHGVAGNVSCGVGHGSGTTTAPQSCPSAGYTAARNGGSAAGHVIDYLVEQRTHRPLHPSAQPHPRLGPSAPPQVHSKVVPPSHTVPEGQRPDDMHQPVLGPQLHLRMHRPDCTHQHQQPHHHHHHHHHHHQQQQQQYQQLLGGLPPLGASGDGPEPPAHTACQPLPSAPGTVSGGVSHQSYHLPPQAQHARPGSPARPLHQGATAGTGAVVLARDRRQAQCREPAAAGVAAAGPGDGPVEMCIDGDAGQVEREGQGKGGAARGRADGERQQQSQVQDLRRARCGAGERAAGSEELQVTVGWGSSPGRGPAAEAQRRLIDRPLSVVHGGMDEGGPVGGEDAAPADLLATPGSAPSLPSPSFEPGREYLRDCSTTTGGIQLHSFNAQQWVYPKGVQERQYQVSCIQTALLHNTLVCLPTGLGKTLIAAVVMHNFTRWFPQGKVVFVAPTRPLVNQQIEACYNFMGVSKSAMAELNGTVKAEERQRLWQQSHMRIFFATPQTFWNDVKKGICPYERLVCLIVDECHRATGNYDIVNAVKHMRQHRCKFRVVGLSATPGSEAKKVQEVIDNLMICKVEHRAESDPEVQPHVHHKDVQLEVVEPSREAEHLRQALLHLLRQVTAYLVTNRVFYGSADPERVSRFMLLTGSQEYSRGGGQVNFSILHHFQQGMFLADLRDQMDLYGLHSALTYLNDKMAEGKAGVRSLASNPIFGQFRQQLEACARSCAQSPKMKKLVEVLRAHFQAVSREEGSVGRVIIFTNLRESVNEIVDSLRAHHPLITAKMFIGQGGGTGKSGGVGMKQREQKAVLGDFRSGKFNVLVATSIGEEGLDIPQVDLIICYDATASPTRAIQRMGRTGRHKEGRVVYILAAGREKEKYESIEENMRQLHRKLGNAERWFDFKHTNPRMLPREFNPRRLDVAVQHLTPEKGAAEEGRSGRGRGRTSGRGRGSGKGRGTGRDRKKADAAAAAVDDGGAGDKGACAGEALLEAARGKALRGADPGTAAAGGADARVGCTAGATGFHSPGAGDGGLGRVSRGGRRREQGGGRGRSGVSGRSNAAPRPSGGMTVDDDVDSDPWGPGPPGDVHEGESPRREAPALDGHAADVQSGRGGMAAVFQPAGQASSMDVDPPAARHDGGAQSPPSAHPGLDPSSPGNEAVADPAGPGSKVLTQPRSAAQPRGSYMQNEPAAIDCAAAVSSHDGEGVVEAQHAEQAGVAKEQVQSSQPPPPVQHQLLFPESASVLSWDTAGRLTIAAPPPLEHFLRQLSTVSSGASGSQGQAGRKTSAGQPGGQSCPAAGAGVDRPATVGAMEAGRKMVHREGVPPATAAALDVSAGVLAWQQDLHAHRWGFLAGVCPRKEDLPPDGRAAEGQGGAAQRAGLAVPSTPSAPPLGTAPKQPRKSAGVKRPRKRKPRGAAAQQQQGAATPGAALDPPVLLPPATQQGPTAPAVGGDAAPGQQACPAAQQAQQGGVHLQEADALQAGPDHSRPRLRPKASCEESRSQSNAAPPFGGEALEAVVGGGGVHKGTADVLFEAAAVQLDAQSLPSPVPVAVHTIGASIQPGPAPGHGVLPAPQPAQMVDLTGDSDDDGGTGAGQPSCAEDMQDVVAEADGRSEPCALKGAAGAATEGAGSGFLIGVGSTLMDLAQSDGPGDIPTSSQLPLAHQVAWRLHSAVGPADREEKGGNGGVHTRGPDLPNEQPCVFGKSVGPSSCWSNAPAEHAALSVQVPADSSRSHLHPTDVSPPLRSVPEGPPEEGAPLSQLPLLAWREQVRVCAAGVGRAPGILQDFPKEGDSRVCSQGRTTPRPVEESQQAIRRSSFSTASQPSSQAQLEDPADKAAPSTALCPHPPMPCLHPQQGPALDGAVAPKSEHVGATTSAVEAVEAGVPLGQRRPRLRAAGRHMPRAGAPETECGGCTEGMPKHGAAPQHAPPLQLGTAPAPDERDGAGVGAPEHPAPTAGITAPVEQSGGLGAHSEGEEDEEGESLARRRRKVRRAGRISPHRRAHSGERPGAGEGTWGLPADGSARALLCSAGCETSTAAQGVQGTVVDLVDGGGDGGAAGVEPVPVVGLPSITEADSRAARPPSQGRCSQEGVRSAGMHQDLRAQPWGQSGTGGLGQQDCHWRSGQEALGPSSQSLGCPGAYDYLENEWGMDTCDYYDYGVDLAGGSPGWAVPGSELRQPSGGDNHTGSHHESPQSKILPPPAQRDASPQNQSAPCQPASFQLASSDPEFVEPSPDSFAFSSPPASGVMDRHGGPCLQRTPRLPSSRAPPSSRPQGSVVDPAAVPDSDESGYPAARASWPLGSACRDLPPREAAPGVRRLILEDTPEQPSPSLPPSTETFSPITAIPHGRPGSACRPSSTSGRSRLRSTLQGPTATPPAPHCPGRAAPLLSFTDEDSQPVLHWRRPRGCAAPRQSRWGALVCSQTPEAASQPAGINLRQIVGDTPASCARTLPSAGLDAAREEAMREERVGDTPEGLSPSSGGPGASVQPWQGTGRALVRHPALGNPGRKRLRKADCSNHRHQQHAMRPTPRRLPAKRAASGAAGKLSRGRVLEVEARKKLRGGINRFIDVEAGVSEGEAVSGDEDEDEDGFLAGFIDDGTQAPPSTGGRSDPMSVYRRPMCHAHSEPSPSPMGAFRRMLGNLGRGRQHVQHTPGASHLVGDSQDDYDCEDSFIASDEGEESGGGDSHYAACTVCREDEGELLMCDACPAVYHLRCLGLSQVPEGDWYCPLCVDSHTPRRCKKSAKGREVASEARSRAPWVERPGHAWESGGSREQGNQEDDDPNTFSLL